MIVGIGYDQTDIRRIAKSYERFGEQFLNRCFTEVEQALALRRAPLGTASTLAKRFAAKEACAKALGTGMNQGVFWRDIGVVSLPSGKPELKLTGGAKKHLEKITPRGLLSRVHITISDEYPYAVAQVLIEALEPSTGGRG